MIARELKIHFFSGKLHMHLVGFEPTNSPSIPLLWSANGAIAHWQENYKYIYLHVYMHL